MRMAKANLGSRVCFYGALPDTAAHAWRITAKELEEAVDREEFMIAYQIQKSLADGETVGYEALLRWQHPGRGLIPPSEFIPVAETSGVIARIGEWVLLKACGDAVRWPALRRVAVNVSPLQLTRDDLPDFIGKALAETGLAANRLELEITESTMIADKARTLKTLQRIRELGVTLALDDFGVGYSSLDVLKSFPFDKIKLDRTFMRGFPQEAKSKAIIKAVLSLGRSLSMAVLAEGVERQEQLDLLRQEGYDQAQGLLLGYPEFGEPHP
jgi:EAL domain-containing protein (putative c-di-GMP-specific phosphodiesterase class I)